MYVYLFQHNCMSFDICYDNDLCRNCINGAVTVLSTGYSSTVQEYSNSITIFFKNHCGIQNLFLFLSVDHFTVSTYVLVEILVIDYYLLLYRYCTVLPLPEYRIYSVRKNFLVLSASLFFRFTCSNFLQQILM